MDISILDGSDYFKGLLLLIRKDRKITASETALMKRIGKALGFEPQFCENAIHDILENKFIIDTPPVFSTKELASKFVKDGLAIAFSDRQVHPLEDEWLQSTAEKNGLDLNWYHQERLNASNRKEVPPRLEVDELTIRNP